MLVGLVGKFLFCLCSKIYLFFYYTATNTNLNWCKQLCSKHFIRLKPNVVLIKCKIYYQTNNVRNEGLFFCFFFYQNTIQFLVLHCVFKKKTSHKCGWAYFSRLIPYIYCIYYYYHLACEFGYYGMGCNQECSTFCKKSRDCYPISGYCKDGCKSGWQGLDCLEGQFYTCF